MPTLLRRYVDSLLDAPVNDVFTPEHADSSLWERYWASLTGRSAGNATPQSVRFRNSRVFAVTVPVAFATLALAFSIGMPALHRETLPDNRATPPPAAYPASNDEPPGDLAPAPISGFGEVFGETADLAPGVPVFDYPGSETILGWIGFGTKVRVACVEPGESGGWSDPYYQIVSSQWSNLLAPADGFANGGPVGAAGVLKVDPRVPRCSGA